MITMESMAALLFPSMSPSQSINPTPLCSKSRFRSNVSYRTLHALLPSLQTADTAVAPPLPPPLRQEALPKHVAIIIDGNGRWATARGQPVSAGHQAGYMALKENVKLSSQWGIRVLTVYTFSNENWLRPKPEVDFIMNLLDQLFNEIINGEFIAGGGIRVRVIGDPSKLPESLRKSAAKVEESTKSEIGLQLVLAISYGGRNDIVKACRNVAVKARDGVIEPEEINESLVAGELDTAEFPDPDLLIRTSGELRLSNFLLWESAYTELYFASTLWPDFGEDEYCKALDSFQKRQRRFGRRIA